MLWTVSWTRALACSASRNYKHESNVNHHHSLQKASHQRSAHPRIPSSYLSEFTLVVFTELRLRHLCLVLLKCMKKKKKKEILMMDPSLKPAKYLAQLKWLVYSRLVSTDQTSGAWIKVAQRGDNGCQSPSARIGWQKPLKKAVLIKEA